MPESEQTNRIHDIFLQESPLVNIAAATRLLGWTDIQMRQAITNGEVDPIPAGGGKSLRREELWAKALEIWPLETIEDVLGPDAERILPPPIRLADLHLRVPRYHIAMLHHLAARDRTTVNALVIRELDALASATAEELSSSLPEFAAAMNWP
jgi:hypothetical protein